MKKILSDSTVTLLKVQMLAIIIYLFASMFNIISGGLLITNRMNQDFSGKPENKEKYYKILEPIIDNYRNYFFLLLILIVNIVICFYYPNKNILYIGLFILIIQNLYAYYSAYKLYKINKNYKNDKSQFGDELKKNIGDPIYLLYISIGLLTVSLLLSVYYHMNKTDEIKKELSNFARLIAKVVT
jgi:hypothetical protein